MIAFSLNVNAKRICLLIQLTVYIGIIKYLYFQEVIFGENPEHWLTNILKNLHKYQNQDKVNIIMKNYLCRWILYIVIYIQ